MISIVDTHCHLDLEAFDEDRDRVFQRAVASGVHAMVLVGYNPERWNTTSILCSQHGFLRRTLGIHPNDADIWSDEMSAALRREIEHDRPVAIGEIGLDFYRSTENAPQQRRAFVAQLEIAAEFRLPVVIHQRAAEDEVINILADVRPHAGVMHCFTGNQTYAERCLDLGLYLGIGGVLTFPRSTEIRDAIATVPIDRLVLETDAPFLAPQIQRGKRNESSLLLAVLHGLATLKNASEIEVAVNTTKNAVDLFGEDILHAIHAGMEYE
ncbi:MAG: TatD family hydrolase [Chloroflexia bacterium]|nr:TatD family hydrolase [Chloroflexia bacterium]